MKLIKKKLRLVEKSLEKIIKIKQYRLLNKSKFKQYRENNKDIIKQYRIIHKDKIQELNASYYSSFKGTVKMMLHSSKRRSTLLNIEWDLYDEFIGELLTNSIKLFGDQISLTRNSPTRASIDQINPIMGYTKN